MTSKFSDLYIEYNIHTEKIVYKNEQTDELINVIKEYKKSTIKKELIPNDKSLYYKWGNIGYTLLFDYNCKMNNKIIKIKDWCFDIEKSIKKGDYDIVILNIKNVLLPLLDTLTMDEIQIIKKAHRESGGPLYDLNPSVSTPHIFIDLFNHNPS
jgi:hypothetical protein